MKRFVFYLLLLILTISKKIAPGKLPLSELENELIKACKTKNKYALYAALTEWTQTPQTKMPPYKKLLWSIEEDPILDTMLLKHYYKHYYPKDTQNGWKKDFNHCSITAPLKYLHTYYTKKSPNFAEWRYLLKRYSCNLTPYQFFPDCPFLPIRFDHPEFLFPFFGALIQTPETLTVLDGYDKKAGKQIEYISPIKQRRELAISMGEKFIEYAIRHDSFRSLWHLMFWFMPKPKYYQKLCQLALKHNAFACFDTLINLHILVHNFSTSKRKKGGIPFLPKELILLIFSFAETPPRNILIPYFDGNSVQVKKLNIIENYF